MKASFLEAHPRVGGSSLLGAAWSSPAVFIISNPILILFIDAFFQFNSHSMYFFLLLSLYVVVFIGTSRFLLSCQTTFDHEFSVSVSSDESSQLSVCLAAPETDCCSCCSRCVRCPRWSRCVTSQQNSETPLYY